MPLIPLPHSLIAFGEEPRGEKVNVYQKMKTLYGIFNALDDVGGGEAKQDLGALRGLKMKKKKGTTGKTIPFYSKLFGLEEDVTMDRVITMLKRRIVSNPSMRIRCACLAIVDDFLVSTSHYHTIVKTHTEMAAPSIQEGPLIGETIESESEDGEDDVEKAPRESVAFKLENAKELDAKCSIRVATIICHDLMMDPEEDLLWSDDEEDERMQLASKRHKRDVKSNVSRNRKAIPSKNPGGVRTKHQRPITEEGSSPRVVSMDSISLAMMEMMNLGLTISAGHLPILDLIAEKENSNVQTSLDEILSFYTEKVSSDVGCKEAESANGVTTNVAPPAKSVSEDNSVCENNVLIDEKPPSEASLIHDSQGDEIVSANETVITPKGSIDNEEISAPGLMFSADSVAMYPPPTNDVDERQVVPASDDGTVGERRLRRFQIFCSGMSDNFKRRGVERGLPIKCRCGAGSVVKTSETMKNPGRLFHCCPYGSKVDNGHLFKWTDIAMVEEIKEVECDVEKIQAEIGSLKKDLHVVEAEMESLACETRTCEAVACRYENEIETIKALAKGCEKEIGELKAMIVCNEKEIQSLRCFKNVIVFSLVLFVVYVFII
ncbi:hypothetical protein AXX17_AT3G33460 [Arabidopsis thaliana]|uniref:GRF-type domain-containing protein n=1 Tax=Arabidopsis thaliana TaxID=3702 RepID=A0A178VEZ1_ARATH|nr:hypothetical protein AXX17_AT3G33460 [Arabidopsis thaliana]